VGGADGRCAAAARGVGRFADETGRPNEDLPVGRMVVTLDERGGKTVMEITSHFPSTEAMEQLLSMGKEEGMVQVLGQIEGILADDTSS
jgi:uncharacterized protein YndB with AHSA1/START domain